MASSESSDDEWMNKLKSERNKVTLPSESVSKKRVKNEDLTKEENDERRRLKKIRRQESRDLKAKLKAEQDKIKEQEYQESLTKGRMYSLSIAIPGSIIDNAQSRELRTYLAGQIGRAAAIFNVDEIIVFNDHMGKNSMAKDVAMTQSRKNDCHEFLCRILQYIETPQYLRKALFPIHSDLKFAGLLNPLDCPHHMRSEEWKEYREGVVVNRPMGMGKSGSFVNIGLKADAYIDTTLSAGTRVTVQIDESTKDAKKVRGKAVPLAQPRESTGVYWGYTTRYAASLSQVWSECTYKGGYDLKIGTSERGTTCVDDVDFELPSFNHALVVFGGVTGIEECVNADESIAIEGEQSKSMFDMWVNTCPNQGSRTIRSEEAMLVSLAALRKHFVRNKPPRSM